MFLRNIPRLGSALTIGILSYALSLGLRVSAQVSPSPPPSSVPEQLLFNASEGSFESEGRPPSRTSAGSRDTCLNSLVALVPGQGEIVIEGDCGLRSESLLALTVSAQPALWFYIPESIGEEAIAELILMNTALEPVSIQTFALEDQTGLVGITLSQPLEVGQVYRWALSLEGGSGSPFETRLVEGIIQRIDADAVLATLPPDSTDQEQLEFYAHQGIWHDALTLLIEQHRADPTDPTLRNQWFSFLDSVGLGAIASTTHPR